MKAATPKEISHLAYLLIKEAGICARCLSAWASPHRTLCASCLAYWKAHNTGKRQHQRHMSAA